MALYKNWSEICRIGRRNKLLMMVLASVTTNEDDEIVLGLWVGFPQCFSETETDGPRPLSVIRHLAEENARFDSGERGGADYPGSNDALDDIPHLCFEVVAKGKEPEGDNFIDWSEVSHLKQGDSFLWQDKPMIVLEVSKNWFYIAPAERIALDL